MARHDARAGLSDTIVAPATAPGAAAIGIVRLSGARSIAIADALFSRDLARAEPGRLLLGTVSTTDAGDLDRALVAIWRAPRSYTGEDMAEFHLHGSPAVLDSVCEACRRAGARLAEPGEFTRRAFLDGKLDLAQAEAVAQLTSSQTEAARRAAFAQLRGGLSEILLRLRGQLVQLTAEIEAHVDYPEEDLPELLVEGLAERIGAGRREIAALLESHERGRRLQAGARVVLAGPPNAGKSSLFNAVLRRERAIVTPHAGTTRDTLEATVDLEGIPLTLIDTAGLRATMEEIERMGIERSREEIRAADLVLFVVDATADPTPALEELRTIGDFPHVVLINKADAVGATPRLRDLAGLFGAGPDVYTVSVTAKEGLDAVEKALVKRLGGGASEGGAAVVLTSARHAAALRGAEAALVEAEEGLRTGRGPELIAADLATALTEIDQLTGKGDIDEEVLDAIFSTFCLGK